MLTAPAKGESQAQDKQPEPTGLRTRLTLRPGQDGTKKLQQKYGERLLAVRYRYDPQRMLRIKTVELIEEALPWPLDAASLLVRIDYAEEDLRKAVKTAGGKWLPARKLWELSGEAVRALRLQSRVVE